jgi:phytoene synthase
MPRKSNPRLSYAADQVRRYDYDRYLTTLFAPADRRAALYALLAFNLEIAKVRETVTEPLLGQIRLQWWREAIAQIYDDGPDRTLEARRHAVVNPLAEAIHGHDLSRHAFEQMIDGREHDLVDAPPETLAALIDYVDATAGSLFHLAARTLGASDPVSDRVARSVGRVWGLTGLLRAIPYHARQHRCFIPQDLLSAAGLTATHVFSLVPDDGLAECVRRLCDEASRRLNLARIEQHAVDPAALPALLPAVLADRYLHRIAEAEYDILGAQVGMGRLRRQYALWRAARRGLF